MTTVIRLLERLLGGAPSEEEPLTEKLEELNRSVAQVQKYELLTTNQYLHQMDIILSILHDIQVRIEEEN